MGSTRVLTDLDGNVVADYNYEAFGELIDSTGDVENNYLFAGEQFDGDLEQYYLRDRYYDQNVGRFLRRDTYEGRLNEPITLHKYLYANANPVYYTDPTGLFSLAEVSQSISVIGALAAIGGVAGIMTQGEPLPPLGGFGDGPQPDIPRSTANGGILTRVLDFGRLRGFGDGPQPDIDETETFPTNTLNDFLIHFFPVSTEDLKREWHPGSYPTERDSFEDHYDRHRYQVGANNPDQYFRKAVEFKRTAKKGQKGKPVRGATPGVKRYVKSGKYIDLAPDGRIVSFGGRNSE